MKIGLAAVSMEIVPQQARREDVGRFIDEAADAGCEMVFFPEYVNCQRTKEVCDEWDADRREGLFVRCAEEVPNGPMASVVVGKCKERRIWCAFGINERRPDGKVQNSYVLVDAEGRIAGRHVKTHLPPCEDGITPADKLELIDSPLGKLGVLTCYELHFPELARMYQILGADIIAYPTTEHGTLILPEARVRASDIHRPVLALSYSWPAQAGDQRPCGTAYVDEKGNVIGQSENRRHLLVVDVPVKKGCNDDRFARRRPEVYRQIVEQ